MSNNTNNKEKWITLTHTLYNSIIEELVDKMKEEVNEAQLPLKEYEVENIAEQWTKKLEDLQKVGIQRGQQKPEENEDQKEELLKKRKSSQSLPGEQLKKKFSSDITVKEEFPYPGNPQINENHEDEIQTTNPMPLNKQESSPFGLFQGNNNDADNEEDDEDDDEDEEEARQKQLQQQKEEELKRQELEEQQRKEMLDKLNQEEKDGFEEIKQEQMKLVEKEIQFFNKFTDPDHRPFAQSDQESSDDESDQELREIMNQKTPNVMFGTYENLRDSAKKWTLKLSNMVMQLNNGEEIFTSSLKVDLDFKK